MATTKGKPKVKVGHILTREMRLLLIYSRIMLRINPKWGNSPEFKALCCDKRITMLLLCPQDNGVRKLFNELDALIEGRKA
jgi:hypothetical protein